MVTMRVRKKFFVVLSLMGFTLMSTGGWVAFVLVQNIANLLSAVGWTLVAISWGYLALQGSIDTR